jgi:hypothetical protein
MILSSPESRSKTSTQTKKRKTKVREGGIFRN